MLLYFETIKNTCVERFKRFDSENKIIMASQPKNIKRKTKFSEDYSNTYSFIQKCSSSVPNYIHKFHCTSCNVNVSCAAGGLNDVTAHVEFRKYKAAHANQASKTSSIYQVVSLFSCFYFATGTIPSFGICSLATSLPDIICLNLTI